MSVSFILKKEHSKSSQFKSTLKAIEHQKHCNFVGFDLQTSNEFALDPLRGRTAPELRYQNNPMLHLTTDIHTKYSSLSYPWTKTSLKQNSG